jgi:hypothetical protein
MKQDEFISMVDRVIHWIGANWRQAASALGGVVALALIYWGVTAFLGGRSEAASQAMEQALEVFSAPVGSSAPAVKRMCWAIMAEWWSRQRVR